MFFIFNRHIWLLNLNNKAKITNINDEDKKISLSMKAVELEENVEPEVSAEDAE